MSLIVSNCLHLYSYQPRLNILNCWRKRFLHQVSSRVILERGETDESATLLHFFVGFVCLIQPIILEPRKKSFTNPQICKNRRKFVSRSSQKFVLLARLPFVANRRENISFTTQSQCFLLEESDNIAMKD